MKWLGLCFDTAIIESHSRLDINLVDFSGVLWHPSSFCCLSHNLGGPLCCIYIVYTHGSVFQEI